MFDWNSTPLSLEAAKSHRERDARLRKQCQQERESAQRRWKVTHGANFSDVAMGCDRALLRRGAVRENGQVVHERTFKPNPGSLLHRIRTVMSECREPMTAHAISTALQHDRAAVSGAIGYLVNRGHVKSHPARPLKTYSLCA